MTSKTLLWSKTMKKSLIALATCCMAFSNAMAQRSYSFNATALNVDGLPEKILFVTVNEGAPGADGAALMGNAIAQQNWDIVGLSEDFNFHSELTAPLADLYHIGTHRGGVSGLSNDTDGLGLLVAKRDDTGFSGESWTQWSTYHGEIDNGADGLINKGFRFYTVTIASGIAVDVYVLHMDAGSSDGDIEARETQLAQLAAYIKSTDNKRPILIIGDTNCRYTRENLKTGFIDVINADSRFTVKDAWVEKIWDGVYPTYGGEAMMWYNAPYNNNTGEVVDKIFYINNSESSLTIEANSYLHNTSFGVSDHYPVIVNFTITDPTATALTDAEKEAANTLEDVQTDGSTTAKPTWLGEQVVSGNSYYVMNVGTGKYIKVGATWQTQATSGYAGTPITVTALSDGKYALETVGNSRGNKMTAAEYPYMDGTDSESHAWTLTPVNASGSTCQYYIEGGLGALTTTTEAGNVLKTVAKNSSDDNQRWVFLTADAIRREMEKASSDYPFNFTPLLSTADFDRMDTDAGQASSWTGFSFGGVENGAATANYAWAAVANSTSAVTASHSLGTLPAGNYNISFEGFYRSQYSRWFSTKDETRNVVVSFGSTNIAVKQNTSTSVGADMSTVAAMFRDNDDYLSSATVSLSAATDVTLGVSKPATSSSAKRAWICLDDFRMTFYGTGEAPSDPTIAYKQMVVTKVNDTYAKVLLLNAAGQAAYDISNVMYRYNLGMVTSEADAKALCAMVDEAYNNAYAAHQAAANAPVEPEEPETPVEPEDPVIPQISDGLKVHFTFADTQSAIGSYNGTLCNGASLTTLGSLPVLSLGNADGYFDMGASVGNVITAIDNFTISTNVYIPTTTYLGGAGNFIYTFANSADIAADANGCIFFRAGDTDSRYAISTERWETEQGITMSTSPFADGNWHTITYRQSDGKGEIYIDGTLVSSGTITVTPSALGVTEHNYLGRPCYVGDAYLKGAMYNDFRIYKGAVDASTLATFSQNLAALNAALYEIQITTLMDKVTLDATVLYEDIALPTPSENGVTITWASSQPSVISAAGQVVRPAAGKADAQVTLTATFTKGTVSKQKSFVVTVPALQDDKVTAQADLDAIALKGHLDNLMSNLYLPTEGQQGSVITWKSSAPAYLDATGQLLQHADEPLAVVLTATATKGSASVSRTFPITLAAKLPMQYYLFAYFNGNAQSQEQICFALSKDGYNYTPLNNGQPIINSSDIALKQAVRDPHILRGEDGYFYMVVTDMRSDEGWASNDGLVLLRSADMVNWSHSAIDFPTAWPHRFDRNSLTQVWAPQTIYDPEEGKYMVYYAIGESGKHYIIYYSYANEDFTQLTEPQVLYDHGANTIDADIVWHNGQYHMFFKTEGNGNGIQKATAKTLRGTWTAGNTYLQQTNVAVEGSGVFRLIDSDTWVLMYDCYTSGVYEYCTSTDLNNFTYKCQSANTSIFTPRHGTTITITTDEALRLAEEWPTDGMFNIGGTDEPEVEEEQLPTGSDADAPISLTATLVPAIADNVANWNVTGSWTTWTSTADGSGFTVPYVRIGTSGTSRISKTLYYLPEGTYTISASCMSYYYSNGFFGIGRGEKNVSGVTLFANSSTTTINTKSGKAAVTLSVSTTLSGTNTLEFGINASSTKATILAMDNVELVYQGSTADYISGINTITERYLAAAESASLTDAAAALTAARKTYVVNLAGGAATTADADAWVAAIETIVAATGVSRSATLDNAEGTTDIEGAEAAEATVSAIYTLRGVRVESLQPGLNIVLMSDGTTRKVMVRE